MTVMVACHACGPMAVIGQEVRAHADGGDLLFLTLECGHQRFIFPSVLARAERRATEKEEQA